MDPLKLKFFSYHLSSSLVIVILLTILCQFYWFPSPFLSLDGTWIALAILATVDVIIGPLLTFLLVSTKKSKRELVFDMFIILIIQVTALSYGLFKIEQERVWAIIHLDGVFNLVPKKEVADYYLDTKQSFPQYKGIYYAMVLNSEISEHRQYSSKPLMYSPERFHTLTARNMKTQAIPYKELPIRITNTYNSNYIFKALVGKKENAIIVLNSNMFIIDIIELENNDISLSVL